mgnify:CR=1 FL=1
MFYIIKHKTGKVSEYNSSASLTFCEEKSLNISLVLSTVSIPGIIPFAPARRLSVSSKPHRPLNTIILSLRPLTMLSSSTDEHSSLAISKIEYSLASLIILFSDKPNQESLVHYVSLKGYLASELFQKKTPSILYQIKDFEEVEV